MKTHLRGLSHLFHLFGSESPPRAGSKPPPPPPPGTTRAVAILGLPKGPGGKVFFQLLHGGPLFPREKMAVSESCPFFSYVLRRGWSFFSGIRGALQAAAIDGLSATCRLPHHKADGSSPPLPDAGIGESRPLVMRQGKIPSLFSKPGCGAVALPPFFPNRFSPLLLPAASGCFPFHRRPNSVWVDPIKRRKDSTSRLLQKFFFLSIYFAAIPFAIGFSFFPSLLRKFLDLFFSSRRSRSNHWPGVFSLLATKRNHRRAPFSLGVPLGLFGAFDPPPERKTGPAVSFFFLNPGRAAQRGFPFLPFAELQPSFAEADRRFFPFPPPPSPEFFLLFTDGGCFGPSPVPNLDRRLVFFFERN